MAANASSEDILVQSVKTAFEKTNSRTISAQEVSFENYYTLKFKAINLTTGFQAASEQEAVFLDTKYMLIDSRHIDFGIESVYELEKYSDISYRTNSFWGINWNVKFLKYMNFSGDLFYGMKTSRLIGIDGFPVICQSDIMASLKLACKYQNAEIFALISSRENFYYPIFAAPIYTLGANYAFNGKIKPEFSIGIKGIDMFALSSYVESNFIKLSVEYIF